MSPGQQRACVCVCVSERSARSLICALRGWSVRWGLGQPVRQMRVIVLGDSLLLGAPGDVVWPCGCVVLVNELLYNLPGSIQLVKVLLEDVLLAELLQEGLPLPQLVVLLAGTFKELKEREISRMGASARQGIGVDMGENDEGGWWDRMATEDLEARLTEEMLVWLAIMSPLTLWAEGR